MNLSELLQADLIQVGSEATGKPEVLQELVRLAKQSPVLGGISEQELLAALEERERQGSTGFGKGIAIPHCKLKGISQFVVGMLIIHQGVDFSALDNKKVRLLFLIIAPEQQKSEHIHLLSTVSRILNRVPAVNEILLSRQPQEARERFLSFLNAADSLKQTAEMSVIRVFIQKEDKFNDILQVFSEMDEISVSVAEGNDASYFLGQLPLFASFWEKKPKGFHRTITAVVRRDLANDILRQISLVDDGSNSSAGVMVTVQDLAYVKGSLFL